MKIENTYSIPLFFILSGKTKSLAVSSCRFNQSFPNSANIFAGESPTAYSSSAGNYVVVDHQDGYKSIYMHLSGFSVSSGTIVSAGQQIGLTGATGIATGDHLHFGISYNGVYVNPCLYVNL